jgi:hypothetical protein
MKVIVKGRENRDQLEIFSIEGFVPADHLLRKIDSAVDFNHIYDIVEDLYCADNGRTLIPGCIGQLQVFRISTSSV